MQNKESGLERSVFIKEQVVNGESEDPRCFERETFFEPTNKCYRLKTDEKNFVKARKRCQKGNSI